MIKKVISKLLIIVLILSVIPLESFAAKSTATTMILEKTEGTIKIERTSGRNIKTRDGMRLINGYTLTTSTSSYAYISLDSSKSIKVDSSSKVQIKKSGKKLELCVSTGKIFFNVEKPLKSDETMNIRTSTMTMGIRGTSGVVSQYTEKETSYSQVQLYDGKSAVYSSNPSTGETKYDLIQAGQMQTIRINPDKSINFIKENLSDNMEQIPGFAAVEIKKDTALVQRIEKESGLNVKDIIKDAEKKLSDEQREQEKKAENIKQLESENTKQIFMEDDQKKDTDGTHDTVKPDNDNAGGNTGGSAGGNTGGNTGGDTGGDPGETPKPAETLSFTLTKGSSLGTTVGTTESIGIGNKLVYELTNQIITDVKTDTIILKKTEFNQNYEIESEIGKYITVYEITKDNKAVKYNSHKLTEKEICGPGNIAVASSLTIKKGDLIPAEKILTTSSVAGRLEYYLLSDSHKKSYEQIKDSGFLLGKTEDESICIPKNSKIQEGNFYIYMTDPLSKTFSVSEQFITVLNHSLTAKLFGVPSSEGSVTDIETMIQQNQKFELEFNDDVTLGEASVIIEGIELCSSFVSIDKNKVVISKPQNLGIKDKYSFRIQEGAFTDKDGIKCPEQKWTFSMDFSKSVISKEVEILNLTKRSEVNYLQTPEGEYYLIRGVDASQINNFMESLQMPQTGEYYEGRNFAFNETGYFKGLLLNRSETIKNKMTILPGIYLKNSEDTLLTINASITNGGSIALSGSALNLGTVWNFNVMKTSETFENDNHIENSGSITIGNKEVESNFGNKGTVNNGGTIVTVMAGFSNEGTITNKGTVTFDGFVSNYETGKIENNGTIHFMNDAMNEGIIRNSSYCEIHINHDTVFHNEKTVENEGIIKNEGVIENSGYLLNVEGGFVCGTAEFEAQIQIINSEGGIIQYDNTPPYLYSFITDRWTSLECPISSEYTFWWMDSNLRWVTN